MFEEVVIVTDLSNTTTVLGTHYFVAFRNLLDGVLLSATMVFGVQPLIRVSKDEYERSAKSRETFYIGAKFCF